MNTYTPAVDAFAVAAAQARTAYAEMQQTVLAAQSEALRNRAVRGEVRVRFQQGDCLTGSTRCRLEVLGTGPAQALVPELGNITRLMGGIAQYAANLHGIAHSDTPQKVNASLTAAAGSIKNLAAETARLPGASGIAADLSAFGPPVANLAALVSAEAVNALQVTALRKATNAADPVIASAGAVLEGASRAAADVNRATQAQKVDDDRDAYIRAPRDRARLDRLVQSAADYDAILRATAPGIFDDMVAGHRDLTRSLEGRDLTAADAFAAIDRFAQRAGELLSIVESLRAAQAAPAGKK